MSDDVVARFAAWIDRIMHQQDLSPVVAYNFNLYEHQNETAVQLVGATAYDPMDEDWACNTYFSSGEDLFILPHSTTGQDWEEAQELAIALIRDYLKRGTLPVPLITCLAITVGFVGGSLEVVYSRQSA